jgi:hypothetical protein
MAAARLQSENMAALRDTPVEPVQKLGVQEIVEQCRRNLYNLGQK